MLNHEEAIGDQTPLQGSTDRNSKSQMPNHHYESAPGNSS